MQKVKRGDLSLVDTKKLISAIGRGQYLAGSDFDFAPSTSRAIS